MANLVGNKGEWSEIYVFLRLLEAGKLYAADENLNKINSVFYNVLKILRSESLGNFEFCFNQTAKEISIIQNDSLLLKLSSDEFQKEANFLFDALSKASGASFSVKETESFLNRIFIGTLKAKSTDKSDIHVKIHDINSGYEAVQGFSIKSRLGSASTLMNAGRTTNFIYAITNINETIVSQFNDLNFFKDKFSLLKENNCTISYVGMENTIFKNNLILIDSSLPQICAYLLLEYYSESKTLVLNALESVAFKNPLNYESETGHPFYNYKFKKFITECALGMLPSKTWTGTVDATGGYIVVREDGEVLCYHLFNRNEFENYLLKNTRFETASTSRHGFGNIYKDNGEHLLKLNMQVRFIK